MRTSKSFNVLYLVRQNDSNKIRQQGFRVYEIASDDDEAVMVSLTSKFPNAIWIIELKNNSKGFRNKKTCPCLAIIENYP